MSGERAKLSRAGDGERSILRAVGRGGIFGMSLPSVAPAEPFSDRVGLDGTWGIEGADIIRDVVVENWGENGSTLVRCV